MSSLGDLFITVGADIANFRTAMGDVNDALKQSAREAKSASAGWSEMFGNMQRIGAGLTAAVTVPIVGIGVAAVQMSEQINMARMGFTTMLGSAEKAGDFLEKLKAFAASTPFEFPDLLIAARRMTAMGFSAEQVIPMLRTIGDAVAAVGGNAQTIDRVTLAFAQMQAKGKVSAQEMNQLAESGIKAWEFLAKSIGKSVPEAMKLAEKGAISASIAIPAILAGMQEKSKGQMELMSKTLTGVWSNFAEKSKFALADIGNTLTPILTNLVKDVAMPLLEWVKDLTGAFAKLDPGTQKTILGFTALAAAAGPLLLVVGTLGQAFVSVTNAARIMGITMSGLMSSIPWVALAASVLTLAKAMYDLHAAEDALAKSGDDQARSIAKLEAHLRSLGIALPEVSKFYRDGTMTGEMYTKHLIALAKAHGDTVEVTEKHKDAQLKLTQSAEEAAKALKHAESVLGVSKINTAEATSAYNLLHAAWNAGKITSIELQKAYDALQQRLVAAGKAVIAEVTPAWIALGQAQEKAKAGTQAMLTAIADWVNAGETWGKKIQLATIAHNDLGYSMKGSKLEAADLAEALMVLSGKYPKVEQAAVDMNKAIKGGIVETAAIMRSVGVKSQEEYRTEVTKLERALKDVQALQQQGKATSMDVARVEMALLRARIEAHDELTEAEKKHYQQLKIMLDPVKALDSAYRTMLNSIKSAFKQLEDDVARGIARSIVEGENLGKAFKNILKNIAEDIITILIKGALAELVQAITGVSGGLAGIFGGGASAAGGAATAAGGAATSAAGGVASTAGTATGAASTAVASSLSGWIGAIGSAATAVSSIIGNFQSMAMNKSLDLIEKSTRFSEIYLYSIFEQSLKQWPKLDHLVDIWGAILDLPERLQWQFSGGFAGVTAAGGGGVTFQINGGYFLSSRALDEFMDEVVRRLKQRNA